MRCGGSDRRLFCSIPIHLRCFATALRAPYPFWITEKQDQDSAGSDTDTTGGRGGLGQWILYRGLFAPPARAGGREPRKVHPRVGKLEVGLECWKTTRIETRPGLCMLSSY